MKATYLDSAVGQYLLAHSTWSDDVLDALAVETRELTGDSARMQISPEQGAFMTMLTRLVGATVRGRGRHVHRLLVDLHRPGPGRRRPAAVLRRERGVDGDRPGALGAGRRRRPHRAADRARRPRRCARCPPTRRSTWRSSTPTSPATAPTTTRSSPRLRPDGLVLARQRAVERQRRRRADDDENTVAIRAVQRPGRRRRPRRGRHAPHRRRPHHDSKALTRTFPDPRVGAKLFHYFK